MKKNTMMRVASILLVAVLLTTSAISGTYAKYITTDSAKDEARVAKFGVVASIQGALFGPTYDAATANNIISWGVNTETVSASDKANVVAPGTTGDTLTFSVKGTPEVSTMVTFGSALLEDGTDAKLFLAEPRLEKGDYGVMTKFTGTITPESIPGKYLSTNDGKSFKLVSDGDAVNPDGAYYVLHDTCSLNKTYKPITWKWKATTNSTLSGVGTTTSGQSNHLHDALKAIYTNFNGAAGYTTFVPNQVLDATAALTWDWFFEGGLDDTTNNPNDPATTGTIYSEQDKADTILGDMIAAKPTSGAVTNDSYVVVKGDDTYYSIRTKEVPVAAGADNKVWVAYSDKATAAPDYAYEAPESLDSAGTPQSDVLAILGAAVSGSLTCTQAD